MDVVDVLTWRGPAGGGGDSRLQRPGGPHLPPLSRLSPRSPRSGPPTWLARFAAILDMAPSTACGRDSLNDRRANAATRVGYEYRPGCGTRLGHGQSTRRVLR